MNNKKQLNLIDLVSEMHSTLRREAECRWANISDIEFSVTELFLLSKTEQESLSISKAAKTIGISRQAMHKCAKKLETRGFINIIFNEGNKRDKYLVLTEQGKECCIKNSTLKDDFEKEIISTLGKETVGNMKKLLETYWFKKS